MRSRAFWLAVVIVTAAILGARPARASDLAIKFYGGVLQASGDLQRARHASYKRYGTEISTPSLVVFFLPQKEVRDEFQVLESAFDLRALELVDERGEECPHGCEGSASSTLSEIRIGARAYLVNLTSERRKAARLVGVRVYEGSARLLDLGVGVESVAIALPGSVLADVHFLLPKDHAAVVAFLDSALEPRFITLRER